LISELTERRPLPLPFTPQKSTIITHQSSSNRQHHRRQFHRIFRSSQLSAWQGPCGGLDTPHMNGLYKEDSSRVDDLPKQPQADPNSETTEYFSAPVKWEQNLLTHSFGTLKVSDHSVDYVPGKISVLGTPFSIPRGLIESARRRDNFLWRGAVTVQLKQPLRGRDRFIFFLGGRYKEFLELLS
jgi:hypothetical protein